MIDRLVTLIKKTQAPIVVGLDPMLDYVPEHLIREAVREHGETLEAAGAAIFEFNKGIVDCVSDLIPAVKPQIAMYEQFGIPGLIAYQKTIDYCHEKGLVVIGDVKRGDIGSTSAAYAVGHLGKARVGGAAIPVFDTDFITVNPYMGTDSVKPFMDVAVPEKKGLFVLDKTSNPSSGEFQDRIIDGRPLYEHVADKIREWGAQAVGESGYSYVGAVVGATYPRMSSILRALMPRTYFLVPGYGAQGGTAKDLVHCFNDDGLGAIVNSSRGIIAAWKQPAYQEISRGGEGFGEAAAAAVLHMREDIARALEA